MAVVIVVGAQWGDEGKGKIVDLLTERARVVVRWAGGANAGHTLVVDGKKHVTRLIPSGVLRAGVTCVLGEGMVIDPAVLVEEMRTLPGAGLPRARTTTCVVAARAHLTLPYHREIDRLRDERAENAIGTTKQGHRPDLREQGGAHRRSRRRSACTRSASARSSRARSRRSSPLLRALGGAAPDATEIAAHYLALGEELRPLHRRRLELVHDAIVRGDNVLFEGAQGVLLDIDHGTYPYVTSSSTTAGGACAGLGIGPTAIDAVLGIAKAYATRVGGGPFPTELSDATGDLLRKRGNEFGSVTGRPRRCGWLDLPALRLAVRTSGIEGLALTKLDVLVGARARQDLRRLPRWAVRPWTRCRSTSTSSPRLSQSTRTSTAGRRAGVVGHAAFGDQGGGRGSSRGWGSWSGGPSGRRRGVPGRSETILTRIPSRSTRPSERTNSSPDPFGREPAHWRLSCGIPGKSTPPRLHGAATSI